MTDLISDVEQIINKYQKTSESLIAVLQDIQEKYHYLPEDSLKFVSKELNVPLSRIFAVATFYNAFSLKPKGRYIIQVCMGTACHIKGAPILLEELKNILNIEEHEITKDGLFSIETVRCLGCCSLAPVVNIGGTVYGNLRPESLEKIINNLIKENRGT